MSNLNCKKPKPCNPKEKQKEIYPPPTPSFEQCVGDYEWKWDGTRLTRSRVRHTPDGTYSTVTVVDGCIVSYDYASEPTYTPPFCSPNPGNCQGFPSTGYPTEGNYSTLSISPHKDNTIVQSSSGLFARTYMRAGDNVRITGSGVSNSPYTIDFIMPTIGINTIGENGVVTRKRGDVTYVGLESIGKRTNYPLMTVDEYGRVSNVSASFDNFMPVYAGLGLVEQEQGDRKEIKHMEYQLEPVVVFGAYAAQLNNSGHVTALERVTTVRGGTYRLGAYKIGISEYGAIQSIEQDTAVPDKAGVFATGDKKVVTYDTTGRITSVKEVKLDEILELPMAIRDMYNISHKDGKLNIDTYGNIIIMKLENNVVKIPMPKYIGSQAQIQVNGVSSWSYDATTRILSVPVAEDKPFTLVLRA